MKLYKIKNFLRKIKIKSFKVRCIKDMKNQHFTVGKIYKIEHGVITRDNGIKVSGFKNLKELNGWFDDSFELV